MGEIFINVRIIDRQKELKFILPGTNDSKYEKLSIKNLNNGIYMVNLNCHIDKMLKMINL